MSEEFSEEIWKKINEFLNSNKSSKNKLLKYSQNYTKFSKDVKELINFIKFTLIKKEATIIYLKRQNNIIKYGRKKQVGEKEYYVIEMTNEDDFQRIYNLLKTEFASIFEKKFLNRDLEGMFLTATLAERIILEFRSNNAYDKEWFHEEYEKQIIDLEENEYEISDVKVKQKNQ